MSIKHFFCNTSKREQSRFFLSQFWKPSATAFSCCLPSNFSMVHQMLGSSRGLSGGGWSDRVCWGLGLSWVDDLVEEDSPVSATLAFEPPFSLEGLAPDLDGGCWGRVLYSLSSKSWTRWPTVPKGMSLNPPNWAWGVSQNCWTASLS